MENIKSYLVEIRLKKLTTVVLLACHILLNVSEHQPMSFESFQWVRLCHHAFAEWSKRYRLGEGLVNSKGTVCLILGQQVYSIQYCCPSDASELDSCKGLFGMMLR